MTDTELLIRWPWCSGEAHDVPELYETGYKVELPGDAAVEVRYHVYRCEDCGRTFSELEGRGEA
jgi:hypothetical protein